MLRRRALPGAGAAPAGSCWLALAVAVAAVGGYWVLRASSAFEVTGVEVAGAPPKLSGQIEAAVAAETHGPSLLGMDAASIAQRVERDPVRALGDR